MDIIAPRATGGGKSISGQPALNSMTKQLKIVGLYVDDKNVYKSDGFIKLFDLKEQDVVLVETSGCFTNNQKNNVNFDHHKRCSWYALNAQVYCWRLLLRFHGQMHENQCLLSAHRW